jgi:hypothetical protein
LYELSARKGVEELNTWVSVRRFAFLTAVV